MFSSLLTFFGYGHEVHKDYDSFLDDPKHPLGRNINTFLIILVLLSIFGISLETVGENHLTYAGYFFGIDLFVSSIFLIEYLYRFWRSKNKISFTYNPLNIIDLLSFLPFFLSLFFPHLLPIDYWKVLRLLRILRLFDTIKLSPNIASFLQSIKNYKEEYQIIGLLGIICLVIFSTLLYLIESGINPGFSSLPQAYWWGIVTMASLGYGDIVPVTALGKLVSTGIIILGPALLSLFSAITIVVFMDTAQSGKTETKEYFAQDKGCPRCETKNFQFALYCHKCGKKI